MKTTTKIILIFALALGVNFSAKAQNNYQINLKVSKYKASIRSVDFLSDSVFICVDANGNATIVPPVQGSFNYYTNIDGDYRQGKLKSAGNTVVDYYDVFGGEDKLGKLKSVGALVINYYDKFDGFDNIGKLKSIGNVMFTYYDKFDGNAKLLGRLKSIGDNKITYYTQFDGFDNIDKLKTIGNTTIAYFDRFDGAENLGKLKSIKGDTPDLNVIRDEM